MPCGKPGYSFIVGFLRSLTWSKAAPLYGTTWSSSPCMTSVGTSMLFRSSVRSVSDGYRRSSHSVIFTNPCWTSCVVLAMASVLTFMSGSRSSLPQPWAFAVAPQSSTFTPRFCRSEMSFLYGLPVAMLRSALYAVSCRVTCPAFVWKTAMISEVALQPAMSFLMSCMWKIEAGRSPSNSKAPMLNTAFTSDSLTGMSMCSGFSDTRMTGLLSRSNFRAPGAAGVGKWQGASHAVVDEPREEIGGDDELAPLRVESGGWLCGNRVLERPTLLLELREVVAYRHEHVAIFRQLCHVAHRLAVAGDDDRLVRYGGNIRLSRLDHPVDVPPCRVIDEGIDPIPVRIATMKNISFR